MPSIAECAARMTAPGARLEMKNVEINGRKMRVWKNLPKSLRSFLLASMTTYSSREFVYDLSSGRSSYGDVKERALRLASWFMAQGLGKGSKVAIIGKNSVDWIIVFIATHLMGGIAVCVNAWLPADTLRHCLALTTPALVFADEDILAKLTGSMHSLRDLDDLHAAPREMPEAVHPDDDATIFFTSGTTGKPKAVLSTQRMALTNLFSSLVGPSRATLRAGRSLPPPTTISDPQKSVLLAIPLFHVTGCLSFLFRAIGGGGKVVLLSKWHAPTAVRLIRDERLTSAGGVPSIVNALLRSDLDASTTLESLFFGGAPASSVLANRAATKFPKTALVQGYGLTETNAILCSVSGQDYLERPNSTGPPVPISDVKIVDPDTRQGVPALHSGLVLVRGPQVMKEYYNDPEATAEAIDSDGWFNTGDVGYVDPDNFLYLQDRLKDLIIRGGENVASTTVEDALCQDHRVIEAAAVPIPCPHLGERVAAVVFAPGANETSLLSGVKPKLPYFAWPSMIIVQSKPLERNATGKVVKTVLKQQAAVAWAMRQRESKL